MSDFGDISTRVGIFMSTQLLHDAKANLILPRFAEQKDLPKNTGTTIQFRRYHNLQKVVAPLNGAKTPTGQELTWTDFNSSIEHFGDWVPVSKHIMDTVEDDILQEATAACSYQMAETLESFQYNTVKGGTSKIYGNFVAARTSVVTTVTEKELNAASRTLRLANTQPVTKIIDGSPKYATYSVEPAFYAYCSPDLEPTLRGLTGFRVFSEYGNPANRLPGEIGAYKDIRFITSTIAEPWLGAGGTAATMKSTDGKADVYPIVIFGDGAFGASKLAGGSTKLLVHNPKVSDSDPLGQRGSVGWETWYGGVRLYEDRMIRLEVTAKTDANL
jgi:N4-gp56 family major capsid protein